MFITRRRHEAELTAARAETHRQRERAEKAEATARTEVSVRRHIGEQNAALHEANSRLTARNKALSDQLAAAQVASGFDVTTAKQTAGRIARLQKAVAKARAEAAAARKKERSAVASELHRSEKARGALEAQLLTVQRSNEAQAAQLLDLSEQTRETV
ncbi:hypothetical protein ACFC01_17880 [Streptomyces mirabilis]|uniref:hypothetical protein n=1 Tax=Streptomyces mirabilis TaxID=68239 RepID=UPI0035D8C3C6